MSLDNILGQTGAIETLARELGIDEQTANAGAAALMPALLKGFGQSAGSASGAAGSGGIADLIGILGGGALADEVSSEQPTPVAKGNQLLGELFGSKDTSRAVAQTAASQSGVDPSILRKMLPILAMAAAGYFAKQSAGQGGLGDVLGSVLGSAGAQQSGTPGQNDIFGQILGAAGKMFGR